MADLNALIAQGAQFAKPPNPFEQYVQMQQLQANQMKMQEAQAAMEERNALRQLNPASADYENQLFKVNPQLGIAYRKEAATAAAQKATQTKAEFELKVKQREFGDSMRRNLSVNPSTENIIAWGQDAAIQGIYPQEVVDREVQALLAMPPADRVKILSTAGASVSELAPKVHVGPSGAFSVPAFGGAATPIVGAEGAFQMTPYQKGQLAVAQGQLKIAQDRLAKEGTTLAPEENAALSKAIIEGRLDPNRVNSRNARVLANTLMADPNVNLLELGVSAAGATAAERSLAGQTAKMSTAANEANKMVDVVRDYSSKVDRTSFPTINAIENAVAKGTGDKDIVQLNTSINALVNSYARAISPTGQPTVADKNHAREIINSAYSQGQIGAILDVMQQEMGIARKAAGTASIELKASREAARGRPAIAPAADLSKLSDADLLKQLTGR